MAKHTKFESSDAESDKEMKDERSSRKKEKKEKSDRDETRKSEKDHKHREKERNRSRSRSPKERRESHKDIKHRDDYKDQRRDRDRRDHYKNDSFKREDRGNRRDRGYNDRNDRRGGNREPEKKRLTEEEIKAQKNALWGNKKKESADEKNSTDSEAGTSAPVAKNEKLWSSAIAATGVASSQASKFMRLMGVKSAPKPEDVGGQLSDEKERQAKMLSDLEKQYAIARETTHMGRGNGLGFH